MRTLCLFMLVLFWIPESDAAALNGNVLAEIVSQFRQVPDSEPSDMEGGGQFSFLMALTPEQCTGANINQNVQFVPSYSGGPVIKGSVNYFLNNPLINYIAVYPYQGSRCSESKLLHFTQEDWDYGRSDSAALLLQNIINNRPVYNRLQVGCVILYTTYTPCIRSCFSDYENCEILGALGQQPFSHSWAGAQIQKYFVFSKLYPHDNNMNRIPIVRNKLGEVAEAGFNIRMCDGTSGIYCIECSYPGYCIEAPYWKK
ncbi:uncharacterized protein [Heterodontus francisci]|uniref:uncharacterized protein n=1 Tax=Heterodontus francisci TaxID=7792 RepID=UPI00355B0A50